MRRLIALIVLLAPAVLQAPAAYAAKPADCGNSESAGYMDCEDGLTGQFSSMDGRPASSSGSASSGARTVRTSSDSATRYTAYNRLTTDANGKGCVTTGYSEDGVIASDMAPDSNQHHTEVALGSNVTGQYPPCPEQPQAPGQGGPIETRATVAMRYWERIPLPEPRPFIAPGRAITGKLAYLETRGDLTHTYTNSTVFGPLTIRAKGSYTISWGDGTTTGPHDFEGTPWPDGRITHEYQDVGSYTIIVTERWTASWYLDGESGVLRSLQTQGTITNFPVEQIEAVIGR